MKKTLRTKNIFQKIFSIAINTIVILFLLVYFFFLDSLSFFSEFKNDPNTFVNFEKNKNSTNEYQTKKTTDYSPQKEEIKNNKSYQIYIESQHPDPIIKEIEKRLNFQENLSPDDIRHLEIARKKRIEQLMIEKRTKIINEHNQNNPILPSENINNNAQEIFQNSNNNINNQSNNKKDSFIKIIK